MPLELVSESAKVELLRNVILQRPPTEAGYVGVVSVAVIAATRIMVQKIRFCRPIRDWDGRIMSTYWTVGISFYNMAVLTFNKVVAVMICCSSGDDLEGICIYPFVWMRVNPGSWLSGFIATVGSSDSADRCDWVVMWVSGAPLCWWILNSSY